MDGDSGGSGDLFLYADSIKETGGGMPLCVSKKTQAAIPFFGWFVDETTKKNGHGLEPQDPKLRSDAKLFGLKSASWEDERKSAIGQNICKICARLVHLTHIQHNERALILVLLLTLYGKGRLLRNQQRIKFDIEDACRCGKTV